MFCSKLHVCSSYVNMCVVILWNILSVDFGRLWKGKCIEKTTNIYIYILISQISDKIMITTHQYIYMFWFPNYFQHILVWASACKVLQHSMPCDTRNLVKHVGIILCMLTISNVYVYIYIYVYMYVCVCFAPPPKATSSQQCWHTSKHCQPATLARQQNESN